MTDREISNTAGCLAWLALLVALAGASLSRRLTALETRPACACQQTHARPSK